MASIQQAIPGFIRNDEMLLDTRHSESVITQAPVLNPYIETALLKCDVALCPPLGCQLYRVVAPKLKVQGRYVYTYLCKQMSPHSR